MVTRKPKSPPPPVAVLTLEQIVWLASFAAARVEIALAHDGTLSAEGAAHLAAEKAEAGLNAGVTEFYRRFPR